jgi:hypothetical protein
MNNQVDLFVDLLYVFEWNYLTLVQHLKTSYN